MSREAPTFLPHIPIQMKQGLTVFATFQTSVPKSWLNKSNEEYAELGLHESVEYCQLDALSYKRGLLLTFHLICRKGRQSTVQ